MRLDSHHLGPLIIAFLIDRALPFGAAAFEHQHRLVRPCSGLQKCCVRLWIDEDVIEHVMVHLHRRLVVAHVESRRQVHPLTIVLGELELGIAGIFRARTSRSCGVEQGGRTQYNQRSEQYG